MTECERIKKAGILLKEFFEEEIVCDFHVTTERKKLFAVLLGVLLKFDSVFKKRGIDLKFLQTSPIEYIQFVGEFQPSLSIIDVMMFNSVDDITEMLGKFELIKE